MWDDGILRDLIEKSAARSVDLAADFLLCGLASEHARLEQVKAAYESKNIERALDRARAADAIASIGGAPTILSSQVPIDARAREADEEETSADEEEGKEASLAICLLKIARDLVLPTTIAAMVAAKKRDEAAAAGEAANGA